jgi:hypothetical protein
MCGRLTVVMDMAGMTDAELSEHLGYSNATTLSGVRRGTTFPDVERLAMLGEMVFMNCGCPNLHWMLTGAGAPFIPPEPQHASRALDSLNEVARMRLEGGRERAS